MYSIFTDRYTQKFSAINFIMILTAAVHALILLWPTVGYYFLVYGGLIPSMVFGGQVWRLLSYAFLHSTHGFFHIAFNMLGLWMFGKEIEQMWGSRKFFEFYIFSAIFAGLFSLFSVIFFGQNANIIGASGAIMALLVVYAYYFPNRQLLFFFVIPMKVKTAVIIYAIISALNSGNTTGNVAHITHLGGIFAGFVWIYIGDKIDFCVRSVIAFFQNSSPKRSKKDDYEYGRKFERHAPQTNVRAEEVDKILDKINRYGIHSLTPAERRTLQEASADYRKNR